MSSSIFALAAPYNKHTVVGDVSNDHITADGHGGVLLADTGTFRHHLQKAGTIGYNIQMFQKNVVENGDSHKAGYPL